MVDVTGCVVLVGSSASLADTAVPGNDSTGADIAGGTGNGSGRVCGTSCWVGLA